MLPPFHPSNPRISRSSRILRAMAADKQAAMAGPRVATFRTIQWIVGVADASRTFSTQRLCRTCSRRIAATQDQPQSNRKTLQASSFRNERCTTGRFRTCKSISKRNTRVVKSTAVRMKITRRLLAASRSAFSFSRRCK